MYLVKVCLLVFFKGIQGKLNETQKIILKIVFVPMVILIFPFNSDFVQSISVFLYRFFSLLFIYHINFKNFKKLRFFLIPLNSIENKKLQKIFTDRLCFSKILELF